MDIQKLKHWATIALAGCDGGNIDKASVWFCGIEWGWGKRAASESDKLLNYSMQLLKEINSPLSIANNYPFVELNEHPYNKQVAKLYYVMKENKAVEDYIGALSKFDVDDIFKLNLFPISFNFDHDKLWTHYRLNETLSNFPTKEDYRQWCRENRLPYFNSLAKAKKPKIIICTGLRYVKDFYLAFGDDNLEEFLLTESTIEDKNSDKNSKPRKYYYAQLKNGTHLFVVPFLLRRGGLNSHNLLKQMGEIMHEKICSSTVKKAA